MAVYVDDYNAPYRNMVMSHMIADTRSELLEMVDKIGVQRKWIQDMWKQSEHYDISLAKKKIAIKHGAKLINARELVKIMNERDIKHYQDN